MTTCSSARVPGRVESPQAPPRHESNPAFGDEQSSSKLYSVALRGTFSILLSIFGLGSAIG